MLLLAFGADKNKTSNVGEKPIDLAKKDEIKQLLQGSVFKMRAKGDPVSANWHYLAKTDQISLFRWMRANDLLEYFNILAAEGCFYRIL